MVKGKMVLGDFAAHTSADYLASSSMGKDGLVALATQVPEAR